MGGPTAAPAPIVRFLLQRHGFLVQRLGQRGPIVVDTTQDGNLPLGLLEHQVAMLEAFDPLFVAFQGLVQADATVLQLLDNLFELGQRLLETEARLTLAATGCFFLCQGFRLPRNR